MNEKIYRVAKVHYKEVKFKVKQPGNITLQVFEWQQLDDG